MDKELVGGSGVEAAVYRCLHSTVIRRPADLEEGSTKNMRHVAGLNLRRVYSGVTEIERFSVLLARMHID